MQNPEIPEIPGIGIEIFLVPVFGIFLVSRFFIPGIGIFFRGKGYPNKKPPLIIRVTTTIFWQLRQCKEKFKSFQKAAFLWKLI